MTSLPRSREIGSPPLNNATVDPRSLVIRTRDRRRDAPSRRRARARARSRAVRTRGRGESARTRREEKRKWPARGEGAARDGGAAVRRPNSGTLAKPAGQPPSLGAAAPALSSCPLAAHDGCGCVGVVPTLASRGIETEQKKKEEKK